MRGSLHRKSSIAALVPHYNCNKWLSDCLLSLLEQSNPPDAVIVIDDASDTSPAPIVERLSQVTLLSSAENVGPYRLIQQVIDDTGYDAYLLNDADDWSSAERLEILLATAEETGAQLLGSQEVRILCEEGEASLCSYPIDVNSALLDKPIAHALLHGTSIFSRELVTRVGGFSTGLKFSADSEFLWRAAHLVRVINVPDYCYFRRKWHGALTVSAETGLGSPARAAIQGRLRERALRNASAVLQGIQPDLRPMNLAPPVKLTHVCGPRLHEHAPPQLASAHTTSK